MVRALLAGRKTQTRRLRWSDPKPSTIVRKRPLERREIQLGACQPGDRLYVREAMGWDKGGSDRLFYKADDATVEAEPPKGYVIASRHAPSIHMPRWASRLTLLVDAVRCEPLQAISESDAEAEGAAKLCHDGEGHFFEHADGTFRCGFAGLWNHLHGAGSWDGDPEVVALTFRVIRGNIDQVPQ